MFGRGKVSRGKFASHDTLPRISTAKSSGRPFAFRPVTAFGAWLESSVRAAGEGPHAAGIDSDRESPIEADSRLRINQQYSKEAEAALAAR